MSRSRGATLRFVSSDAVAGVGSVITLAALDVRVGGTAVAVDSGGEVAAEGRRA